MTDDLRKEIAAIIEAAAFDVYAPKDRTTRLNNAERAADKILALFTFAAVVNTTGEQP